MSRPRRLPAPPTARGAARPRPDAASARQSSLRASNLALLATHVFASAEPVSRADVAAATGMTRSTASRLADELVASGLLAELAPVAGVGPGRPAVPLTPARGTFAALGMEVNVSRMTVRAVDLAGAVLSQAEVLDDFEASDPTVVLARLAGLIGEVLAAQEVRRARLVGAALALPGLVSHDTLLRAPNLGWHEIDPRPHLAGVLQPAALGLRLGNEADFGALTVGRHRPAAAHAWPSYIYLSGEIGLGAGIVRDRRVMRGTHGFAGEIGHVQVDPAGPRCSCGNRGCLERYAGRRHVLAAAGLPETASPSRLIAAWGAGEPRAREAVSGAARALGAGLAAAINILDIPIVVLGGHLAPLAEVLGPELAAEIDRRVLAAPWAPPRILTAPSDQGDGATGAAWSLLEEVVADPASHI
ncbi:MAG: ROK family transcriptional regulator [Actinomyces sp.]|uniref:ROK family transcriptional regulator n=1 Tax=Actinomyces sp. TaxID=29317 RepID=UPI0026DCD6A8|nr:ROK family transcriptional regulator [Actinomyces sp.]MDO4242924.1 ROK family transcriptional regulator [Actinomyces sp.]